MDVNNKKESDVKIKQPLKCRGCREPHMLRDCPHRTVLNIEVLRKATTVNNIVRNICRISAVVEYF